jgi:hypothetical protein
VEEAAGEWWGASLCPVWGGARGSLRFVGSEGGLRLAAVAGVAVFAGVMLRAGGLADSAERNVQVAGRGRQSLARSGG